MFKKTFVVLATGIMLAGCQKILDRIHNHPAAGGCQITGIASNSESYIDSTTILYNTAGQPVNIIYTSYDVAFNGYHTHTFNYNYNNQNRLISQTSDWVYSQDQVYYAYEGNAKEPVRDTIPKIFGQVIVEDFEYDGQNRINKVTARTVSQWEDDPEVYPTLVYKYVYDAQGNRQEDPSNPHYAGTIQYSNKPSLYSLNNVWQIVQKDYSRNSVLYVDTYNDKGLPTSIKKDPVVYFQSFLNLLPGSHIDYSCE